MTPDLIGGKDEAGAPHRGLIRERGSVLIEALVALAIVAMLMGATYQAIAGAAARSRAAESRRTALLVARSALESAGAAVPLSPGRSSGLDGDLVWRLDVAPYRTGFAESTAGALYSVTASVHRRDDTRVLASLRSLRLGPG